MTSVAEKKLDEEAGRALIQAVETPEPLLPRANENSAKGPKPYDELHRILGLAFNQAALGKGKERHAEQAIGAMPWHHQPILVNARQVGPGGPAMQVMKKAGESVTMAGNLNFEGAKAEALGAIVYAAALYKLYEEMEKARANAIGVS